MENNIDLMVINFKERLLMDIRDSGLSITIISLILNEITNVVNNQQQAVISELRKQKNAKEE